MKIRLYKSSAPKNKVNKINDLTLYRELEGNFRAPASITNPVMTIEFQQVDEPPAGQWDIDINYAYIPDFNRYYFISGMTLLSYNKIELSLAVDVLYSFRLKIQGNNALIARNQYDFDRLITDPRISFEADRKIELFTPDDGELVNISFSTSVNRNIVVNNGVLWTPILTYQTITSPTDSDLPSIPNHHFNNANTARTYALNATEFRHFSDYITYKTDVQSYFFSAFAYPFDIPISGNADNVRIETKEAKEIDFIAPTAPVETNVITAYYPRYMNLSPYLVIADFELDEAETFMDFAPYTEYEFFLPFLGFVNIDPERILGKRTIVYYSSNYATGDSSVYVYSMTDKSVIFSSGCNLATPLSIMKSDAVDVNRQKSANQMNIVFDLFSGGLSTIFGMSKGYSEGGQVGAVKEGVIGGLQMAERYNNYSTQQALTHSHMTTTASAGVTSVYNKMDFYIKKTTLIPTNDNYNLFVQENGYPLNQNRALISLSGYTEVSAINLTGLDTALSSEQDEIVSLLKSGVIF